MSGSCLQKDALGPARACQRPSAVAEADGCILQRKPGEAELRFGCIGHSFRRGTELRKIPDPTWYRLQRAIEPTSSTMIALTPRVLIASAHARLIVEGHFDLQALHREPAENLREIKLRVTRKRTNHGIPIPSGLAEAG